MFKHLGSTAVIITLMMGVSPVALAETKLNGVKLNGVKFNGVKLNGTRLNGVKFNGVKLNGTRLNGQQAADAWSAMPRVTAITLADGTQLRAR